MRIIYIGIGIVVVLAAAYLALYATPMKVAPLLPPATSTTTTVGNPSTPGSVTTIPAVSTTPFSHTFTAHIGDTVTYSGFSVTLVRVAEDSRCPIEVQCIQAGTVRVDVKAQKGIFSTTETLTLGVPISAGGFTAELTQVQPDKHEAVTLTPSEYTFVFKVSGG